MKHLKSIAFSVLLVCSAFFAVTYTACKKESKTLNPCANLNCLNGGACNNGVCICPTGFEGTYCEKTIAPPDPCLGVNCQNGGTCIDGNCNCPAGYEGEHCEIKSSLKYLGNYTATEPGYPSYNVVIMPDPTDPTKVLVENLGNYSCSTGMVLTWGASVTSSTLTISDYQCSTSMTASLTYSITGGTITLSGNYTAIYGSTTEVNPIVLTRN